MELCLVGEKSPGLRGHRSSRGGRLAGGERPHAVRGHDPAPRPARAGGAVAGVRRAGRRKTNSHMALLAQRAGGLPDLSALRRTLRASGGGDRAMASDVCWVFPALADSRVAPPRQEAAEAALATPSQVQADADALRAARESAQARMARPLSGPISAGSHEARRESFEARREEEAPAWLGSVGAEGRGRRGRSGRAAGDRHGGRHGGALARWRTSTSGFRAKPWRRHCAPRSSARSRRRSKGPALRDARQRAGGVLDRFVSGRSARKARGPRVPSSSPASCRCCWRRTTGERGPRPRAWSAPSTSSTAIPRPATRWSSTTRPMSCEGDEEIRKKAGYYSVQGARYARALRLALDLPRDPRFELWFLHADVIWPPAPTE